LLVDSHCHLDFPDLANDIDGVLKRMRDNDVVHAVCIGVTLENWPRVRAIAEAQPALSMTVGVHPDEREAREPETEELVTLATTPKVVAIGETGLDYYRATGDLEWQRQRFRTHIRAARVSGKPLVIHTRAASADTLAIMRTERADEVGGVMHCFTETMEVAEAALDLGFHISFSGIVTFKNATELKNVAKKVPLDRILVETDSPYLAPVPHRGKRNEPSYVRHVAEYLAQLRGISLTELAASTTENFQRLFRVNLQAS